MEKVDRTQRLQTDVVREASRFLRDKKILIIVPAYNEEGSIQQTIGEIRSLEVPVDILVVNDGSTDGTLDRAKAMRVNVADLPFNVGIGGAVQTGFRYAEKHGFDIAVQVDGDGQHDVSYFKKLIDPVIRDKADLTIGSRFLPPFTGYRSSFVRRIGIHFFARLISLISQYRITDPTSGFRAVNRKMIRIYARHYPTDYPEPEAIIIAGKFRARVREVPVNMRKRAKGSSSIRYLYSLYYMAKVTLAILLTKLRKYDPTE